MHSAKAPLGTFAATACAFALLVPILHFAQNRIAPIGGAIALAKTWWLCTALFAWLALPALLWRDRRLPTPLRTAYLGLLLLMAARALVEIVMMYAWHNWSPYYGIAHDLLCMLWLIAQFVIHRRMRSLPYDTATRAATANLLALTLLFVPEIYFAHYMVTHFDTTGAAAVFFVPDTPEHDWVLRLSVGASAAFLLYLAYFARRWLRKR